MWPNQIHHKNNQVTYAPPCRSWLQQRSWPRRICQAGPQQQLSPRSVLAYLQAKKNTQYWTLAVLNCCLLMQLMYKRVQDTHDGLGRHETDTEHGSTLYPVGSHICSNACIELGLLRKSLHAWIHMWRARLYCSFTHPDSWWYDPWRAPLHSSSTSEKWKIQVGTWWVEFYLSKSASKRFVVSESVLWRPNCSNDTSIAGMILFYQMNHLYTWTNNLHTGIDHACSCSCLMFQAALVNISPSIMLQSSSWGMTEPGFSRCWLCAGLHLGACVI